jgi:hypothetical protein
LLRDFDFDANSNIDPAAIRTLASCEWIKKGEPLCLIGDSGTGKSHLLIALGTEAAMAGFRVRYVLAAKLVNELVEAADERQLTKTIARYGRVDLLAIDELGYMELDHRGAELLFQVLIEREEKASVAIASNESLGGWTKTFTDPRLCAAIVDRLTFAGNIIETGTDSYRLAHAKTQQGDHQPGLHQREGSPLLPPRPVVDQQVDRRDLRDDGKTGEQVGLRLLHDSLVLPLGDGQMRDNVVELPPERRVFRPPLDDRLG